MPRWLRAALCRASAFLAMLLVCGVSAAADPCCRALSCVDLPATSCLAQGGIPGYCRPGSACSAATCSAPGIGPIRDLLAVKAASDVRLVWTTDAQADRYNAWFVLDKRDVPRACAGCGPERAVPGGTPTTVAEVPHPGAVDGPGGLVLLYDVSGACGSGAGAGACCELAATCSTRAASACV